MPASTKTIKPPKVAIVGRTNVGKSTLFNRLIENQAALISSQAGTTRDRRYGEVIWQGRKLVVIDTGGLEATKNRLATNRLDSREINLAINRQIDQALKEATAIVFLVDAKDGLLPQDKQLAQLVRKLNKPTLLVVNKVDQQKFSYKINDFYQLGLGDPLPISASNGSQVGDLLDQLVKILPHLPPADAPDTETARPLRLALIGKPNVGKSSLINALLGEERVIVSSQPHTTREPQDTPFKYKGQNFILIDTAGIRKKNKISPGLESKSVDKSLQAVSQADVAVLIVEAQEPLGFQEKHLTKIIKEADCGVIIAANKWDLVEDKNTGSEKKFLNYFYSHFPFLTYAPIVFVSAKTKQRVRKILDLALEIKSAAGQKIPDKALDRFIKKVVKQHRPSQARGAKHPRIFDFKQVGINPPTFIVKIDQREGVHSSYMRFLENRLRENFGLRGTSVKIISKFINK
ncbi:MAG: ribosome biogenesis GTPase Der [bacterium]